MDDAGYRITQLMNIFRVPVKGESYKNKVDPYVLELLENSVQIQRECSVSIVINLISVLPCEFKIT